MLFEPEILSLECLGTEKKWSKYWTANRRQVGVPTITIRLDKAGPTDGNLTQAAQVDLLAVQAMDAPGGINHHEHGSLHFRKDWTE